MRWLICLLLFLAGCAPSSEQRDASSSAPAKDWSVRVDGRLVPVHVVQPKTPPPWPTAMLLHGSSGLGRGYLVWPVAYALAARGVASAVVEYFDALPDQVGHKGAVQYFSVRERQLDAVVDGILAQSEVMGPQIGVYGYSLGGFHGLALAVTNPRVAAVVSLAGGLPRHVPLSRIERASPVLLVHGTRDKIVPFARAAETQAAWRRHGRPVRLLALQDIGHVPRGADRAQLVEAAADFIAKELFYRTALR